MIEEHTCQMCGTETEYDEHRDLVPICPGCKHRYPAALVKATVDPFDYALGLRDGTVIRFEQADVHGEWVHITGVDEWNYLEDARNRRAGYSFARGLDVRLSDIVWVADAPMGS